MKALVISDTHDNLQALEALISNKVMKQVDVIIHLGDIVSPFSLKMLLDTNKQLFGVFGNNDGDIDKLKEMCPKLTSQPLIKKLKDWTMILFHGFKEIETTRTVIYSIAVKTTDSIILYGHTHQPDLKVINNNLVMNPGTLSGYLAERKTFGILEIRDNGALVAKVIDLDTGSEMLSAEVSKLSIQ